jgi:hypothetical protein
VLAQQVSAYDSAQLHLKNGVELELPDAEAAPFQLMHPTPRWASDDLLTAKRR